MLSIGCMVIGSGINLCTCTIDPLPNTVVITKDSGTEFWCVFFGHSKMILTKKTHTKALSCNPLVIGIWY